MIRKINSLCSRVPLLVWCALVFFAAVSVRVHWIQQKEAFHCDESMSISLCSVTGPGAGSLLREPESCRILTGAEVKEAFYGNAPGVKDFAKDIFRLRENNHDYCHTNAYYSLLRCALYGADTTDMQSVVARGFALNIALFSVGFIFFALLLRELFERKISIVSGLVAGTLCPGTISMTVFLRPYDLNIAAFLFFAWVFVLCAKKYLRGESLVSWKNLWLLSAAVAGTLLSVYFAIVFVILLGATLCVLALKKVGRGELPFLASVFALGVVSTTAVYPNYPIGFLIGRGSEAASKFSPMQILSNIANSVFGGLYVLAEDAMLIPAAILLIVAVVVVVRQNRKKENRLDGTLIAPSETHRLSLFLLLFVPAFLAFWATLYLAPYKILRYVVALLPILMLAVPAAFSLVRSRTLEIVGNLVFIGCFVSGLFFLRPIPMTRSGDVNDWLSPRNISIGVKHLVYSEKNKEKKSLKKIAVENPRFVILDGWRVHGLALMRMPDSTTCAFIRNETLSGEIFDVASAAVPDSWKEYMLIVPTWGRPSIQVPKEIILPRGKVGEEISVEPGAVAFPFIRDESLPATVLRLDEQSASRGGNYYAKETLPEEN